MVVIYFLLSFLQIFWFKKSYSHKKIFSSKSCRKFNELDLVIDDGIEHRLKL